MVTYLQVLPDARTRITKGEIFTPLGWLVRTYCISCGRPGGWVGRDRTTRVFYLCGEEGNNCVEKYGPEALAKLERADKEVLLDVDTPNPS